MRLFRRERQLVGFALDHGAGVAGRIFRPWSAVRGDLGRACARAGIEPCSPNDLRRTTATWMRQGGVAPDVIGALLGHADGRMVERVYGRMTTGALAERIRSALDCSAGAADSADLPALPALPAPKKAREVVPRDGIEPPTRGFSVPPLGPVKCRTPSRPQSAAPTLQRRCS